MLYATQPYSVRSQYPCTLDVHTGRLASAHQSDHMFKYAVLVYGNDDQSALVVDWLENVPTALLFVDETLLISTTGNKLCTIDIAEKIGSVQVAILPNELVGISNFFYNKPRGWIIVAGRDHAWNTWRDAGPFTRASLLPCPIPAADRVSFSEDGARAICTRRYQDAVNVYDTDTGALLQRFVMLCADMSPLWKNIVEIARDTYALAVYNEGKLYMTNSTEILLESAPRKFCGPEIIGVDTRSQTVYVREWAPHGRVTAVTFWLTPTRGALLRACVI